MDTQRLPDYINLLPAPEKAKIQITEMIRSGQIKPGSRIDQKELAKKLNLTIIPVREALSALTNAGFLKKIPGMGIFCKAYTVDEIEELIEIRGVLEGLAAKKATEKITEEEKLKLLQMSKKLSDPSKYDNEKDFVKDHVNFHKFIAEISKCPFLIQLLENTHITQEVLSNISASIWPVKPHNHTKIAEAVCSDNPESAETEIKKHIAPTYKQRLNKLREKYGDKPIV
jgi:DNA-binding GntR family transcriptional regulator